MRAFVVFDSSSPASRPAQEFKPRHIRDGKLAVRALAGTLIQLSAHTKESTFIFYNLCVLYSQVASTRILSHTNVINVKVLADNGSLGVN